MTNRRLFWLLSLLFVLCALLPMCHGRWEP